MIRVQVEAPILILPSSKSETYYPISHVPITVSPKKKLKSSNGVPLVQQPKNTVAMLNELRQGLVYNLEGQTGPVHAPVFTMTVEVNSLSLFAFSNYYLS